MSALATTRVVLLGTGAGPTPKAGRQPTAAVLLHGNAAYVIDCGNGVGPQLVRAGVALKTLRAIFITHHHLDHVADFGTLVTQAWSQLREPITLTGPPPLARMSELYRELFSVDLNSRVAEEGRTPLGDLMRVQEITGAGECYADDHVKVTCLPVPHGAIDYAFAYRFDCADRSVVFSGDTALSLELAEFAKGAHALVHEAVFPSALHRLSPLGGAKLLERITGAHTAVEQAALVASRAGVAKLVLSPLAPADGVTDDEWIAAARTEYAGEIVVGRDLLEV
ncbi:MAG: MBL fold metallo-hydrolase [Steroidobacteraceae bacterium]